jgi:hypothetical protein
VTVSEFAFLAMGLVLGIAAGAALILIVRSRRPAAREVRVTMTPDAVPRRRAATLANDAFAEARGSAEPARGGPAERHEPAATGPGRPSGGEHGSGPEHRTAVHVPVPGTIVEPAFKLTGPTLDPRPVMSSNGSGAGGSSADEVGQTVGATALPIASGVDPMLTALRASAAAAAEAAMRPVATAVAVQEVAAPVVAAPEVPVQEGSVQEGTVQEGPVPSAAQEPVRSVPTEQRGEASAGASKSRPASTSGAKRTSAGDADDGGPCAEPRRIADERCELATRARAQATEAEQALRDAQREYDDHETVAAAAAAEADPRAVRQAKDEAQARFRAGRAAATTNEEVEAAARTWLLEINDINGRARDAATTLAKAHAKAPEFAVRLERTAVAADAARISAEAAESTCLAARQTVAQCEEQAARGVLGIVPPMPPPGGDEEQPSGSDTLVAALRAGTPLRVVRLLRGDRNAMQELVAALADDSSDDRRRWQLALSDLVDAILADSIEASALEFPTEHSFWGPFSLAQSRDITQALSSLVYRFDGLGGWVDERVPSQRDLSLALGYAGIDPMRMRHWPSEAEMQGLFSEVEVAAAEHVAGAAGDLTLGELVTMLGRRADGLTEIWNAWGRIRPLLLEET